MGRKAEDEDQATKADMGGKMEAYYDKKLKRWIFPGDDPAEVAKPLAPPPTIPKASDTPATPAPAAASSNDPLAMLMAPPSASSRGLSSNKKGAPMASRYADPFVASMGNVSASSGNKIPPSPMMNQAPPTFTTFQPKPATKAPAPNEDEN